MPVSAPVSAPVWEGNAQKILTFRASSRHRHHQNEDHHPYHSFSSIDSIDWLSELTDNKCRSDTSRSLVSSALSHFDVNLCSWSSSLRRPNRCGRAPRHTANPAKYLSFILSSRQALLDTHAFESHFGFLRTSMASPLHLFQKRSAPVT